MIWVVPCRYNGIVHECVAAIREHNPDDPICVVDSCNDDTSYLTELDPDHVIFENTGRWWGAYRRAYDRFAGVHDDWALIHDSLIVNQHIDPHPLQAVNGWLDFSPERDEWRMVATQAVFLDRIGFELPAEYRLMFGGMSICDSSVLECYEQSGLFKIDPQDRYELNTMERIVGVVLAQHGFDLTHQLPQGAVTKHLFERL